MSRNSRKATVADCADFSLNVFEAVKATVSYFATLAVDRVRHGLPWFVMIVENRGFELSAHPFKGVWLPHAFSLHIRNIHLLKLHWFVCPSQLPCFIRSVWDFCGSGDLGRFVSCPQDPCDISLCALPRCPQNWASNETFKVFKVADVAATLRATKGTA